MQGQPALEQFQQMQQEGVHSDSVYFVQVLSMHVPVQVHLTRAGVLTNKSLKVLVNHVTFVANSLVDMYAKCGRLDDAQRVFNKMPGFGMP
jgi:pentatricopeptide repeat protein